MSPIANAFLVWDRRQIESDFVYFETVNAHVLAFVVDTLDKRAFLQGGAVTTEQDDAIESVTAPPELTTSVATLLTTVVIWHLRGRVVDSLDIGWHYYPQRAITISGGSIIQNRWLNIQL